MVLVGVSVMVAEGRIATVGMGGSRRSRHALTATRSTIRTVI